MSGPLPAAPVLWPCMPALFMPAVEFMFAWFSFVVLWMDVGSREMFAGNWLLFAIRGKLFLCLRRSKVCVNQEIECSLWQTTFGNADGLITKKLEECEWTVSCLVTHVRFTF